MARAFGTVLLLLTLVVIPVLYSVLDRKEYARSQAGAGPVALTTPAAPPAPAYSPER